MMMTLLPVLYVLGILAVFSFGALFGAWLVESNQKRDADAKAHPLMEVAPEGSFPIPWGPLDMGTSG